MFVKNPNPMLFLVLLAAITWSGPGFAQATQLFDGDFESGTFQGWTPSGENGGFATVAAKGSCYSGNDTTAISFNGNLTSNYAALLRSNAAGQTDSIAKLRSQSFVAGNGVIFSALSETLDPDPANRPVSLTVNIINSTGEIISEQPYLTAIVQLSQGCPSVKSDGAFSSHFIDTHHLAGQEISIEFTQHTNVESLGYFTLIDNVLFLNAGQFVLSTSQPIAVAGTGLTTSGTFFLDPRASVDPDDAPVALSYSWFINGEDSVREIDLPCVNLNEDFNLSAGNNTATLYVNDGFSYAADTIRFVVPAAGDSTSSDSTTTDDSTTDATTNTDDTTDDATDDSGTNNDGVTLTDPADQCDVDLNEIVAVPDSDTNTDGSAGSSNSAPVIDVNGSDGNPTSVNFTVDGSPVIIAPNVTITDADGDDITSVTVSIQNDVADDSLTVSNPAGLEVTGSGSTTITFNVGGQNTAASGDVFESAIESIVFEYTVPEGTTADTTDRTITYTVNDGTNMSDPVSSTVTITP